MEPSGSLLQWLSGPWVSIPRIVQADSKAPAINHAESPKVGLVGGCFPLLFGECGLLTQRAGLDSQYALLF